MGFWNTVKRIGAAVATGGASEVGRAVSCATGNEAANILTNPLCTYCAATNDDKKYTEEVTDPNTGNTTSVETTKEGNPTTGNATEANTNTQPTNLDYIKGIVEACGAACGWGENEKQAMADYYANTLNNCDNPSLADLVINIPEGFNKQISTLTQNAQANADAASEAETAGINSAIQQRQAGINAGVGRARAGLLGDSSAGTTSQATAQNAYTSNVQNQGATQADYLAKMGQACALCNCAQNINKGATMNAFGAALQGAGQGASLGASLGGSK